MTRSASVTPSLWDQTFDSLDSGLRKSLNSTRTHKRDILEAVLKEIEAKRDLALRKRWKFKKPNGDIVVVRDVLGKFARWIYRFKETGDVVAQYNPAHLSLQWAAFRFVLQISVSEIQVFGAMADDLENIARIITRYREFERLYLQATKSELELMLQKALIRLYVEILTRLARGVSFFREKSIIRLIKTPFRTVDEKQLHQVLAQEAEVLKIAKLIDTDKILNLEAAVTRLSNYIDWQASNSPSILLMHGITGSGKSMLCSMIVDALLSTAKNDPSVAPFEYIYCANPDFEEAPCSSDAVMRSILGQLALDRTGRRTVKNFLYSEYERQIAIANVNGVELPRLRTQDCVRLMLELAEQDSLSIIIDAIDTFKKSERHALVSTLEEIVLKADNVVKVLVTSRSSNIAAIELTVNKQIQITSDETKQNMKSFVNHLIDTVITSKLLLEGRVSPALRNMLIKSLLDGAEKMFLWVKLQIERLCREKTEDDVVMALESNLPEYLNQLYEKSLSHIFEIGMTARDAAIRIFS
ncbi:MAG: hypothetical protein Q9191_006391 [Dirinaria sp. TL-2023a]